ncbi:MAG: type I methionyl aminopeptidase [Spirochaetaceae bacterium]|nr:type I methionyl aminopeptidase [Spirochaetaceae bacterium]
MILLKTPEQIDGIRKSCREIARLLVELKDIIKPGMSTKQIDTYCETFIKKVGGRPAWPTEGFPAASCISVNEEVIHGVPSKTKIIKDGDLVSVDLGMILDGYVSDSTVTFPIGTVSKEKLTLLEVTTECLNRAIAACVAGNRLSDIAHAVYDYAHSYNYGVVYDFCGHGVGLKVHENPSVFNVPHMQGGNIRIKPGMVLALEPMINLGTPNVSIKKDGWTVVTDDGLPSCHMEHTVAVFEDHTEVLTSL